MQTVLPGIEKPPLIFNCKSDAVADGQTVWAHVTLRAIRGGVPHPANRIAHAWELCSGRKPPRTASRVISRKRR
jgi:hypothetical protein